MQNPMGDRVHEPEGSEDRCKHCGLYLHKRPNGEWIPYGLEDDLPPGVMERDGQLYQFDSEPDAARN